MVGLVLKNEMGIRVEAVGGRRLGSRRHQRWRLGDASSRRSALLIHSAGRWPRVGAERYVGRCATDTGRGALIMQPPAVAAEKREKRSTVSGLSAEGPGVAPAPVVGGHSAPQRHRDAIYIARHGW